MPVIEIEMPPERGPLAAGIYECRLVNVQVVAGRYGDQIELTFALGDGRTVRAWVNPQSRRRVEECLAAGLAALGSDGKVRFGGRAWAGVIYVNERGRVTGFVPARLARGLVQSEEVQNG